MRILLVALCHALIFSVACSGPDPKTTGVNKKDAEGSKASTEAAEKPAEKDVLSLEGVKMEQVDRETGKVVGELEFKVIESEKLDSYILYDEKESSRASLENIAIIDADGQAVDIELKNKVTIIEYWNKNGLQSNQCWNRMRELEHRFEGDEGYQFISLNWDSSKKGMAQVEAAKKSIVNYSQPKNLLFDSNDGFRSKFHTQGGSAYYLIDHRGLLIASGRGDNSRGMAVFDKHFENQVKAFTVARTGRDHVPMKNVQ